MDIKEGHLARHYLEMNIAVLAVERKERQVKLAGVHGAVLPTDGQRVLLPGIDVHCREKTVRVTLFYFITT